MKKYCFKRLKEIEKGSVTLFVLSMMIFLTVILFSIYARVVDRINNQNKMISEIESEYNEQNGADMEQRYREAMMNEIN